jgi:hypothetical protein
VARGLNADGVPTTHGGKQWYPSTIKALTSDARETVSEETT